MIVECKRCGLLCDSFVFVLYFDEEGMLCLIDDEPFLIHPGWVGAVDDGDGSSDEFIAGDRFRLHANPFLDASDASDGSLDHINSESEFFQCFFYPRSMVSLQFDSALFDGSAACTNRFKATDQCVHVKVMGI